MRSAREKRGEEQLRELANGLRRWLKPLPPAALVPERLRLAGRLKPQSLAHDGWSVQQRLKGARVEWLHACTVFAAEAASGCGFVLGPSMAPSGLTVVIATWYARRCPGGCAGRSNGVLRTR